MGKLVIGAILCGARGFFDSLASMLKFFDYCSHRNILWSDAHKIFPGVYLADFSQIMNSIF
jgi:hypothetical protein